MRFKVKTETGERTISFSAKVEGDELRFTRSVEVGPGGMATGRGMLAVAGPDTFTAKRVR